MYTTKAYGHLKALQITDPELDAERIYYLGQCARRLSRIKEFRERAEELARKQNRRTQLELDERKMLSDLDTRWRLKDLDFQRFKTRTAQLRELQGFGAVSQEELSQAHLQEQRAEIELQQLEADRRNLIESTQAQLEALQLEMNILKREVEEAPSPLGARPHPGR